MPENQAAAGLGDAELHHVSVLRDAAMAAVSRHRAAFGSQHGGTSHAHHAHAISGGGGAGLDFLVVVDSSSDRAIAGDDRVGDCVEIDQPDGFAAAALHA